MCFLYCHRKEDYGIESIRVLLSIPNTAFNVTQKREREREREKCPLITVHKGRFEALNVCCTH